MTSHDLFRDAREYAQGALASHKGAATEREALAGMTVALADALEAAAARADQLEKALTRAAYVSKHLFGMIDRETWRSTGGDDGQGHYEGDYRAEKTLDEIREWAALAGVPAEPATEEPCPYCDGGSVTVAAHHPACDGSCRLCPVPEQQLCSTCGGRGWLPVSAEPATEEKPAVECGGGPYCAASPHRHGCFADRGDCDKPGEHAAPSVSAGTKFRCERCGAVLAAVSAGAGQVPADTIEKAREALHDAFPLVEALPVAGTLVEEALDALARSADSLTRERAALAEAGFLMQMPLRYAIEAYEDAPVRTRLLEQHDIVVAALAAVNAQEPKA